MEDHGKWISKSRTGKAYFSCHKQSSPTVDSFCQTGRMCALLGGQAHSQEKEEGTKLCRLIFLFEAHQLASETGGGERPERFTGGALLTWKETSGVKTSSNTI